MRAGREGRSARASWFIGLAALALYLATLSRAHTGDSLDFASAVEAGSGSALIDPSHLLLAPLGFGFYRLWQAFGWAGGAMLPLQVLNALGGALAVGLMAHIAGRLARSDRAGVIIAAGFAVSFGVWLLSTQAEFVTIPLAAGLAVLGPMLAVAEERPVQTDATPATSLLRPIVLGLGAGLAVLTYLTNAALALVGLAAIGVAVGWPRARRLTWAALLLVSMFLIAAPVYLALAGWALAAGTPPNLLMLWSGSGMYGQFSWRSVPHGLYGFLRTLIGYPGLVMNDSTAAYLASAHWPGRIAWAGVYTAALALAAAVPWLIWRTGPKSGGAGECRRTWIPLGLWAALAAAFGVFWVPGDISFWMPVLAAWWLLVAWLVRIARAKLAPARRDWPLRAVLALAVLLMIANAAFVILPDRFAR